MEKSIIITFCMVDLSNVKSATSIVRVGANHKTMIFVVTQLYFLQAQVLVIYFEHENYL